MAYQEVPLRDDVRMQWMAEIAKPLRTMPLERLRELLGAREDDYYIGELHSPEEVKQVRAGLCHDFELALYRTVSARQKGPLYSPLYSPDDLYRAEIVLRLFEQCA